MTLPWHKRLFLRGADLVGLRPAASLDANTADAQHIASVRDRAIAQAAAQQAFKTPPQGEIADLPLITIANWNIQGIKAAVDMHCLGSFGQASVLVETCLGDDRVQAALNGRTKGIIKSLVSFEPSKTAEKGLAKKVALDVEDCWGEIFPETIVEQIVQWWVFTGFALFEIVWESKNDKWIPRLKHWHPYYIYYQSDIRQYIALTAEGPLAIDPNDPKWFLFTPFGSYRGWMRGAVRSVTIPWIVRQFALRDWARYSEKHGLPQTKVKVPAQATVEDKQRFFSAVKRLGAESSFLLPVPMGANMGEWDIELLEAKADTWQAFKGLREACDESITLSIRGTNLTTSVKGGSFAAAKSHRDEDSDYAESDCRKFARSAKHQVLSLYCLYNYGDANLAPTPKIDDPEEEDTKAASETLVSVAEAIEKLESKGWPIDRAAIALRFEIPLLEGKDVNPTVSADAKHLELTPSDIATAKSEAQGTADGSPEPEPIPAALGGDPNAPVPPDGAPAPGKAPKAPKAPKKGAPTAPKSKPDDTETDLPEGQ